MRRAIALAAVVLCAAPSLRAETTGSTAPPPETPASTDTSAAPPPADPAPAAETITATETTADPADEQPAVVVPTFPKEPAPPAVDHGAQWIKGDLVHVGTRRLLSRFSHVGVSVGATVLDSDAFLTVTPGMAWYVGGLSVSAGVPLNLLAFEGGTRQLGSFKIRRQDWDEISDFARVIRFVTWGRKEDRLYFTINSLRPATLGHGALVNNYNANIDIDRSMTGLAFDAYNDWGGFQIQANDVTFQNRVVGALAFLKPLDFVTQDPLLKSLSLGVEYAGDLRAPQCVRMSVDSTDCVQGSGLVAGNDPFTGQNRDRSFVRTDPVTGRPVVQDGMAHAVGVSAEMKIAKVPNVVDVKAYLTGHQFLNAGGGDGEAAGLLGRFNLGGGTWTNAFRIRAEYRNFGDGYLPAYFDSLYEIQKYAYPMSGTGYQVTPTKYQAVFGDAANGFTRPTFGRVHGYNLDLQWGLYLGGARGKLVSLGLGMQDSQRPDDTRFHLHLEFPLLGFVQLFGTFMRVNAPGPAELFGPDMFTSPNTVVLTGVRLQLLPILFVNAHYSRSFRVTRSPGSEYHLGNELVVDGAGQPSKWFRQDAFFENVQTLWVELELGWEFNSNADRAAQVEDRLGQPSDQEGR